MHKAWGQIVQRFIVTTSCFFFFLLSWRAVRMMTLRTHQLVNAARKFCPRALWCCKLSECCVQRDVSIVRWLSGSSWCIHFGDKKCTWCREHFMGVVIPGVWTCGKCNVYMASWTLQEMCLRGCMKLVKKLATCLKMTSACLGCCVCGTGCVSAQGLGDSRGALTLTICPVVSLDSQNGSLGMMGVGRGGCLKIQMRLYGLLIWFGTLWIMYGRRAWKLFSVPAEDVDAWKTPYWSNVNVDWLSEKGSQLWCKEADGITAVASPLLQSWCRSWLCVLVLFCCVELTRLAKLWSWNPNHRTFMWKGCRQNVRLIVSQFWEKLDVVWRCKYVWFLRSVHDSCQPCNVTCPGICFSV